MRRAFLAVSAIALLSSLAAVPASAQINIQGSDGETVNIGPNGISVQKRGERSTVHIGPGSITVDGGNSRVNTKTTRVQTRTSKSSSPKKVTTKTTTTKSVSSAGATLDSQVSTIEIAVYGKKTVGAPLVARVEKLEVDNIGSVQSGSVKERIVALAKTLGVKIDGVTSTTTTHVTTSTGTATGANIQINHAGVPGGERANVEVGGNYAHASRDIVIDDSNQTLNYVCNGNKIVLNSSNCTIRLKGVCGALIVNGSENNFECESVKAVSLNGSGNNLRCGNLGALSFTGSNNNVTWRSNNQPVIDDSGSSNNARRM